MSYYHTDDCPACKREFARMDKRDSEDKTRQALRELVEAVATLRVGGPHFAIDVDHIREKIKAAERVLGEGE